MKIAPAFIFLLVLLPASGRAQDRESRLIAFAEDCIMTDLMVRSRGLYELKPDKIGCKAIGLAIVFIGERDSPQALQALASLVRYGLDGELGEDYTCYVAEKGKKILPYFQGMDVERVRNGCKKLLSETLGGLGLSKLAVEPDDVCKGSEEIRLQVKTYIEMISQGGKCDKEDW